MGIPPWEFDTDSSDDVRHLWYKLTLVAMAAEAEAHQMQVNYKANMQYKNVG